MLQPQIKAVRAQVCNVTTSTKRTRGNTWMAIRHRVLTRDCGLCQVCDKAGRLTLASEVDHIVPLAAGGTDHLGNLQAICSDCHTTKTAAEAKNGSGHTRAPAR